MAGTLLLIGALDDVDVELEELVDIVDIVDAVGTGRGLKLAVHRES
jgi:hypothetical protein